MMRVRIVQIQKRISSKKEVDAIADLICRHIANDETEQAIDAILKNLLMHRVNFPLLEHVASRTYEQLPKARQLAFLRSLARHDQMGTSVLIGKFLGLRCSANVRQSFGLAAEFIITWDSWYACDQTSERVFGAGILKSFDEALPILKRHQMHANSWIRRSVGIAVHFATKRRLTKSAVKELSMLMLSRASSKDKLEQKGIGWALKTIARHHPDLLAAELPKLRKANGTGRWAISKIETGLSQSDRRCF